MDLLAIDLGKQSFHIHGITSEGEIISRKVSRVKFKDVVASLAPVTVAMEACANAHHWGCQVEALGCMVRLIHPRFVKPFVKGSKNDAVDADAIYEAALRPTMRFVPVKTTEQQDLQMIHRTRDRLITQRTALSRLAADMFTALITKFQILDTRIAELDRKLVDICRTNEQCRRLANTTRRRSGRCHGPCGSY